MNNSITTDKEYDASGLNCPLPILWAKKMLNEMDPGTILKIICTDPSSVEDFKLFSQMTKHKLLAIETSRAQFSFWIKKIR